MSLAPRSASGQLTVTAFVVSSFAVQIHTFNEKTDQPAAGVRLGPAFSAEACPGCTWHSVPASLVVRQSNGGSGSFSVLGSISAPAWAGPAASSGQPVLSADPRRPAQLTTTGTYGQDSFLLPLVLAVPAGKDDPGPTIYLTAIAN